MNRHLAGFAAALEAAAGGDPGPIVSRCVAAGTIHGDAARLLACLDPDIARATDNLVVVAVPGQVTFTARQLRRGWTRRDQLDLLATITVPL